MDQELELSPQDLNEKAYMLFLEFMTRTAQLEELANTEMLRRPSFIDTSKLVNSITKVNQTDRMKAYVKAGCKNIPLDVQSISKLHSCKQGLQNHVEKAKILFDELDRIAEDAICVMRMADESISHFLDESSGNGVKQDVLSFEEEETEPIHLQDSSILYATIMMVIYQMLKLDYAMQENIVKSLDLKTTSSELESYCLMWDLRPYINDSIMRLAWSFVA
ncbi:hypothetical protein IHE45_08G021700 [Dioscorea alata]|uniref:Uncharacterized protein n=2 Tax=Dioscorea alata TaxID=55571 RepID=A0ACB7VHN6_DIOAL|nr:hypothetical protein IHE45_08G021700 [Dioscorea alata]KAH7673653.1 hypothetical protein IHE45_08G021700 [Dioscorea alata]